MENSIEFKKLDVSFPPVSTFFHVDIPLTILFKDSETYPWIYSNYIQLYSINNIEKTNPCFVDFYHSFNGAFRFLELSSCPWILFERISRKDVVEKWGDILTFLKEKINENKYIGITVDAQKITNYKNIKMHNLFVYGYDDRKKVLYAADHFRYGKYEFEEVSYDEFLNSVLYSYDMDLNWGNLEGICVFSKIKREHKNIYILDMRKIVHELKEYLLLEGYAYRNDEYFVYGIECYDNLIKYYSLVLEEDLYCDVKGIYTEICHKIMMVLRLKFLEEKGYNVKLYIKEMEAIRDNLIIAQNLIIKYDSTENKDNLKKCISNLNTIKNREINIFSQLIDELSNELSGHVHNL